jgi:hypothetical protein
MPHWKRSFPSRFLQAADLDVALIVTIAGVTDENVSTEDNPEIKPVLRLKEPGMKAVVLNMTRGEAIEEIVGDPDTDNWVGHRIRLFRGTTRYQNKKVPCISIGPAPGDDIDEALPTLLDSKVL